jgi:predicted MFS family arabinose efflux permease
MPSSRFLAQLREGWSAFRSRTWLWVNVAQSSAGNLGWVAGFTLLGPVIADRRLGGVAAWGYISAGLGAGLLAGSLLAAWWHPHHPLYVGTLATFTVALPVAALAAALPTGAIVAAAIVAGIGLELFGVLWETAVQQHVPTEQLSRVSSYDTLGSFVFIPIGDAVGGVITGLVGVDATIWGSVALIAGSTALALFSRSVRKLPRSDIAETNAKPGAVTQVYRL